MNPEDFDVLDLLPQRPPFIMVDKLTYYDPIITRSVLTVRDDNMFCKDSIMEEAGLIENIAQTCAARIGYKEKTEPHRDGVIKIGFIGLIKRMEMFRNPHVGEVLNTTIEIKEEVLNLTLVETRVEIGEELIAICEMKVFLTDAPPDN